MILVGKFSLTVGAELLAAQRDLLALGDTAYYSAPVAAALQAEAGGTRITGEVARSRSEQATHLVPELPRGLHLPIVASSRMPSGYSLSLLESPP